MKRIKRAQLCEKLEAEYVKYLVLSNLILFELVEQLGSMHISASKNMIVIVSSHVLQPQLDQLEVKLLQLNTDFAKTYVLRS